MEFNFEENECNDNDNGNYTKIQIKKDFVIFYYDTNFLIHPRKNISIKVSYMNNDKYSTKEKCEYINIEMGLYGKEEIADFDFKPKSRERLNNFIDFIMSITDDMSKEYIEKLNKIDDIFDFLIGQKRFEENKDSL